MAQPIIPPDLREKPRRPVNSDVGGHKPHTELFALRGMPINFLEKIVGRAKDEMMRDEERLQAAIEIAIQSGHMKRCEIHGYAYSSGEFDYTDAYKLGNYLMTHDEPITAVFDGDRRAMTDKIKEAIDSHGDVCPGCDKVANE